MAGTPERHAIGLYGRKAHGLRRPNLDPGLSARREIASIGGAARAAGVEDVWTWGYEARGHMSYLGTREPDPVWNELVAALTERRT